MGIMEEEKLTCCECEYTYINSDATKEPCWQCAHEDWTKGELEEWENRKKSY